MEKVLSALLSQHGILLGVVVGLLGAGTIGYNLYHLQDALYQINENSHRIEQNHGDIQVTQSEIDSLETLIGDVSDRQDDLNRSIKIWLCSSPQAEEREVASRLLGCEEYLNER